MKAIFGGKFLVVFAAVIVTFGVLLVIGVPRHIRGRWVRRRIEWYEVGPGLPIIYPGKVDYVYRDPSGKLIQHGPYHRYVLQSMRGIQLDTEGFFENGLPDGTFTEWNTYDGTKMSETFYVHGKQVGDAWYQRGKLFQYQLDLFDGNRRIATKTYSNGKWLLDKVAACLNFTIDPQSGELRYLNQVTCQ